MSDLRYDVVIEDNPGKGPKKKTPWIVDGKVRMGDSELIIDYLRRTYRVDLDAGLSAARRAIGLAWQRTFEEHYHQAFEHQLFLGSGGCERLTTALGSVPAVVRPVVGRVLLSRLRRQLYARGLGRHSEEDILAMGKADLEAASAFLAERPYFAGDEPCTADATAFGFLGVSIYVSGANPLFAYAASLTNLVSYTERMRARYFPETLPEAKLAQRTAS